MDKLKLLLVADTYYPKVDGTLRFMEEFLKRSRQDFEITLLVPDFGLIKNKKIKCLDVYKHIQISGYPSIRLSLKNLSCIKNCVRAADLVFVQGPALASYLSILYAHRYKRKVIVYTHTLFWEIFPTFLPVFHTLVRHLLRRFSIILYNRCSALFVPYHGLKLHLMQEGVTTPMYVSRLGVDINKFAPSKDKAAAKAKLGIDTDKMVIGYVGRISKEKNTHVLGKAFAKLPHQDSIFLLLVGDGPATEKEPFQQLKHCKITGFVYNVQDYLQAMDVFVMPSLTETTSLATLEAMSSGLPLITTKVGFIQNYVVKNYNGLFFPARSPTLLALKIQRVLEDEPLRQKLSYNARKTVAYSFSWERSINKIKRLLVEVYDVPK